VSNLLYKLDVVQTLITHAPLPPSTTTKTIELPSGTPSKPRSASYTTQTRSVNEKTLSRKSQQDLHAHVANRNSHRSDLHHASLIDPCDNNLFCKSKSTLVKKCELLYKPMRITILAPPQT